MPQEQVTTVPQTTLVVTTPSNNLPMVISKVTASNIIVDRKVLGNAAALAQAEQMAKDLDFRDPNQVLIFGASPQEQYKNTLMKLLEGVSVEEVGMAGDLAVNLETGMDLLKIEGMQKEVNPTTWRHLMVRLPWVGTWFSHIYGFAKRKQAFVKVIQECERQAKQDMTSIMAYNQKLQTMLESIHQNYLELAVYIVAGQIAYKRGVDEYEVIRAQALESGDARLVGDVNRVYENITAFDGRLLRMMTAYVRAPISDQQVGMGQQGGRIEIQNIMDGLLFDLPRLLEAANQVAALYNLQKAQARRKKREAVADRIDRLSEELLEETFVAAKESQARGAQEVEALREKATAIAELLKKGKEIDRNNRSLRKQAVASLGEIQTAFNQALEEVGTADTLR